MKKEVMNPLKPQNRERNQKIASILALLISFTAKIEKLKQKLCGFSPRQFSPESIFEALDLTSKGYLDLFDIKEFLSNDRIQEADILKLFVRFGATLTQPRLTYHGYLQLLKPHFSLQLGRDLLLRDTLRKNIPTAEKTSKQPTQTIVLLIHDLFLYNCICISQHEQIKVTLMEEYMLNELELIEILGLSQCRSPLKAIYQFIDCNSEYAVEEAEIRYLLAYLRVSEFQLCQQPVIANLFLPTRIKLQQYQTKKQEIHKPQLADKDLELIRMNYDKKYIGKNDLLSKTQKISFLNYVHPNSYKYPQAPPKQNHPERNGFAQRQDPSQRIGSQHAILDIYNDQNMKKSIKNFKKIDVGADSEKIFESQVQPSNIFESRGQIRLVNASQFQNNSCMNAISKLIWDSTNLKRQLYLMFYYKNLFYPVKRSLRLSREYLNTPLTLQTCPIGIKDRHIHLFKSSLEEQKYNSKNNLGWTILQKWGLVKGQEYSISSSGMTWDDIYEDFQ